MKGISQCKKKEKLDENIVRRTIDNLDTDAKILVSTMQAIEDALLYGPNAVENYEWALNGVGTLAWHLSKKLEALNNLI